MVPLSQGAAQNIAQRRAALGIAQQDLNSYVLGIIDGLGRTPNTFQRIVDDENGMPQLLAFGPAVPSLPAPGPSPTPRTTLRAEERDRPQAERGAAAEGGRAAPAGP
jgi:hypothetical protein